MNNDNELCENGVKVEVDLVLSSFWAFCTDRFDHHHKAIKTTSFL